MSQLLSKDEIIMQSERAFERWKSIWYENAEQNGSRVKEEPNLNGAGLNKKIIILSFGVSLEENIRDIKKHNLHYEYDIMCIDKSLHVCLAEGLIPKYCVLSDAQVSFEEYGNIPKNKVKDIVLFSAVTGNYKWTKYWSENNGKVYFYLNKDHIRTHRIFAPYVKNNAFTIPASSNVGNAAYVISALYLRYKQILLGAYDYSFTLKGKYYGRETSAPVDTNLKIKKKTFYNHYTLVGIDDDLVQASHNMTFSAKWLIGFIEQTEKMGIETVNITGHGILKIRNQAKFRKEAA